MNLDQTLKILLVEDSPSDARLLQENILLGGLKDVNLSIALSLQEAVDALSNQGFDVMLLDLSLPDSQGLETVEQIQRIAPDLPIVVLTGIDDEKTGVEAVRMGIQEYLVKGQTDGRLIARAIRYAIERQARDKRIIRLTSLYSVLSRVNETIVRTHDEITLYTEICRIVAEDGAFPLVWVGLVQDRRIVPAAHCGPASDYLKEIRVETGGELGQGPTGTCIRENRTVVNDDFVVNPNTLPWREAAQHYKFRASAALPLRRSGKPMGALTLYASEPGVFDAEQVRLLEALGADVSYALDALEEERRRTRAEGELRELTATLERRVAERTEALRHQGEVFRKTVDHIPVMLTFYDETLKTFTLNRAFEQLLGWTAQDAQHLDLMAVCYPDPEYRELIRDFMEKSEPGWRDLMVTRKDGSRMPSSWANVRLSDGSRIGIGIDITERQRAEEQQRALNAALTQRAEQLRALAAELAQAEERERRRLAQVLHDHLQQLLVGANFSIATALMNMADHKTKEDLKQVQNLLNQSIEASRSLTAELSPPILYDRGLPEALHWLARWEKEKQGLAVELHLAEGVDASMNVRLLLFQATRELLFNVVKHAGVLQADIYLEQTGANQLKLVVADRGKGFDPERLHSTDRTVGGLGLFSIRERLEWMGGSMNISSIPGRGARITLVAPTNTEPPRKQKPSSAAPPTFAADLAGAAAERSVEADIIRVLIADDHRIVRQGLSRLLQETADIKVIGQAENGQQALNLTRQLHPDVVIMDISMPVMNGIDATRIIVAERPQCRVIALSMHQQADMELAMREAGAVAYLPKDGPAEQLIDAIRGVTRAD